MHRAVHLVVDQVYICATMTDAERITALESRITELERVASMRNAKIDLVIAGLMELKAINRELGRLNDAEMMLLLGKSTLQ